MAKYTMMDNIIKRIDELLDEGVVVKSRTRAMRALNDKARKIHRHAEKLGFDSDISEVSSPDDITAAVEIQLGKNKRFKRSQVAKVVIHDIDDYAFWLPVAVAIWMDTENYSKYTSLLDVKRAIREISKAL